MTAALNMRPKTERADTGIDEPARVAEDLRTCLADTYVLMIKTQGYHWNAVGPLFHSVHELTEEQYNDMFAAADELAERIRALGHLAPTSMREMGECTGLREDTAEPTTREMIANLVRDHEMVSRSFRECAERAEEARDIVTADMLTERLQFHEKAIWMLRALLAE